MKEDVATKTDRCQAMIYPVSLDTVNHVLSMTMSSSMVFLFSGSWRLHIDATYLELRHYRQSTLPWHARTLFIEPQDTKQYHYILGKLRQDNLIIMHSDHWCSHRPLDHILADMHFLRSFFRRVICSLPLEHANFNKLTMSVSDLCETHAGISIYEDSLIMIQ